jgi:hypothetical protein
MKSQVPKGRSKWRFQWQLQSSLRDSTASRGTPPNAEALGYSRMSLRDKDFLNKWYDMREEGHYSVTCTYSLKGPFEHREKSPMWAGALSSAQINVEIHK